MKTFVRIILFIFSFVSVQGIYQICFALAFIVQQGNASKESTNFSSSKPLLQIVQLGDSYSAGNGARSVTGSRNYVGVSGCYRSPTNWGSICAHHLGDLFNVRYINRACSRASLSHLFQPQLLGYHLLDRSVTPDYPGEEFYKIVEQTNITQPSILQDNEWARYATPQINAIDLSVNLVLMTMGFNDLNFIAGIVYCYFFTRNDSICNALIDDAYNKLPELENTYVTALLNIYSKLNEHAKIVVVSYPHITLPVMYKIVKTDITQRVRDLAVRFDQLQINAIRKARLTAGRDFVLFYNGTKNLFEGHEPDPSIFLENPNRWIAEFEGFDIMEWYHLNDLGHQFLGEAVAEFIRSQDIRLDHFQKQAVLNQVFVVAPTTSMRFIHSVRTNLDAIVDQLSTSVADYRAAVVSFETCEGGYRSRIVQDFTNDVSLIKVGIDSLNGDVGCNSRQAAFPGINDALDLSWAPWATKILHVVGSYPEVIYESQSESVTGAAVTHIIPLDTVAVTYGTGKYTCCQDLMELSPEYVGNIVTDSDLSNYVFEILNYIASKPSAWIGTAYVGAVGREIIFDATGSFDPLGEGLVLFEWDFTGDGIFDHNTTELKTNFTYDEDFNGVVILRVTSVSGATALASAKVIVNRRGYVNMRFLMRKIAY